MFTRISPSSTPLNDLMRRSAALDNVQANFEANKAQFTEEEAWNIQASIDTKRFEIELEKLVVLTTPRSS